MKDIDELKAKFTNSDWKTLLKATNELVLIGGDDVVSFFIGKLSSKSSYIRNAAALGLRDIGDDRATKYLIDGVLNPIESNRCATLAYSLEAHDCSLEFLGIFRMLFYSNYECKWSAHNILSDQEFFFTDADLLEVKRMWSECLSSPKLCPAFEDSKDGIQGDVDSYLCYLSPNKIQ